MAKRANNTSMLPIAISIVSFIVCVSVAWGKNEQRLEQQSIEYGELKKMLVLIEEKRGENYKAFNTWLIDNTQRLVRLETKVEERLYHE